MLRFLVDESATVLVTDFLRDQGYDVLAISERSPGIPDTEVLRLAVEQGRVLITADKDFGELIFKRRLPHRGVLLLRPEDDRPISKVGAVRFVLANYAHLLVDSYIVSTERSVRLGHRRTGS